MPASPAGRRGETLAVGRIACPLVWEDTLSTMNAGASLPVWRITGLFWRQGRPRWVASRPDQADRSLELGPGTTVRLGLADPRACVGRWDGERGCRRWCTAPVPARGTDAQCAECAANDQGRLLARDAYTDDRTYLLYLAWFGPGLVKVGLTAAERGRSRLLEQGALAYTELGRGPLPAVRAAERAIAATDHAVERLRLVRKLAALSDPEAFAGGHVALERARAAITAAGLLDLLEPTSDTVHLIAQEFGLVGPLPAAYDALTGLQAPAGLVLRLEAVVGRVLIGAQAHTDRPLFVDTRLLAGFPLAPSPERSAGLRIESRTPSPSRHDLDADQIRLF
ncbi:DUF2797 domain-containing protein [Nocardiopsis sp. NPDC007018]|uniref:DUF2797 domain-containing protein n=1 Tax=Nocardiopsis sp. NPDC007018 TaxID=3155721 RepID=UPI0033EF8F84